MISILRSRRRLGRNDRTGGQWKLGAVGLGAVALYTQTLGWAMQNSTYNVWGVLVIFPFLVAISLPILWKVTKHDVVALPGLLSVALVTKLLASLVRYLVVFQVYGGTADATGYHTIGTSIANEFYAGRLSVLELIPRGQGTQFIQQLTGLVYAIIGPTKLGGFMVFSWMGFWGLFLMYRAALIGFPEIAVKRYAMLLFFAPSLLFWPSSIGKESWLMMTLGLTFYGAARLIVQMPGGIVVTTLGAALTALVRPHVTAVAVVSLGAALVFRRSRNRASLLSPIRKIAVLALLAVGISIAISQAAQFLGPDASGKGTSLSAVFDRVQRNTSQGGSAIDVKRPNNPLLYPQAFFTVMFRPTLIEVRSTTSAISALETTALLALFVISWGRLKEVPSLLFRRPYLLFCLLYAGIFAFAWSSIGNLGIIARQRVLAWPFMMVFLALPKLDRHLAKAPNVRQLYGSPTRGLMAEQPTAATSLLTSLGSSADVGVHLLGAADHRGDVEFGPSKSSSLAHAPSQLGVMDQTKQG